MMPSCEYSLNKLSLIKTSVILLVIFLFLFMLPSPAVGAPEATYGDIDGDGKINVLDVVLVMRYALDLEELGADQRERADVTGNGSVDVQDIVLIMQWVLELVDEFPVEAVPKDTFFGVEPNHNSISGSNWLAGEAVTVSFGEVEIVIDADQEGQFEINQWQHAELDIEIDQTVIVTDGITTKTHIVRDLKINNVDAAADIVYGTASAGNTVEVRIFDMERDYEDFPIRTVVADDEGNWLADFTEALGEGLLESAFDIMEDVTGEARITDLTGDFTHLYWSYGEAGFQVFPGLSISGFNWAPQGEVTITVGDDQYEAETDSHGYFTAEVEASAGDTVEVTDGITTKQHVVTALEVTEVDRDNGIISGTAEAGTTVYIELLQPMVGQPGPPTLIDEAEVEADQDGTWTVNFAIEIEDNIDIVVMQEDDDGNRTVVVN